MAEVGIPVVDFSSFGLQVEDHASADEGQLRTLAQEIYQAFSNVGFVYLKNHGMDFEKLEHVFKTNAKFFQLPLDVKSKYVRGTDTNDGWVSMERESLNPQRPADLKEAFNFSVLNTMIKWPTEDLEFSNVNVQFFKQCLKLTERILEILAYGLNLDRKFFQKNHSLMGKQGNATVLRSLYYPPIPKNCEIKPNQVRCGEHSDYGTLTLLFQDDVGGLEVQTTDGSYIPATPIPGTIVVNIGDLMQRWTADKLKSTKHRVMIPPTDVDKQLVRQSLAFFVHPNDETLITCLDGSNKYEPITSLDYLNYRFSLTY